VCQQCPGAGGVAEKIETKKKNRVGAYCTSACTGTTVLVVPPGAGASTS
jgi:hypothetical protein